MRTCQTKLYVKDPIHHLLILETNCPFAKSVYKHICCLVLVFSLDFSFKYLIVN